MKIVTAAEMRAIDRASSERFGVPSLTLMENAGAAVAEFVLRRWRPNEKIVLVCGKGNNGGDGFVAARLLHEKGKPVQVVLLADPAELKGDAAEMYTRLAFAPTIVRTSEELKSEQVRQLFIKAHDVLQKRVGAIDIIVGERGRLIENLVGGVAECFIGRGRTGAERAVRLGH